MARKTVTKKTPKGASQFAQGDVLFTRVGNAKDKYPGTVPQNILEGEFSGHIHTAFGHSKFVPNADLKEPLTLGLLTVGDSGAEIRHVVNGKPTGDHDSFKLPGGEYKVTRQREFRQQKAEYVID